MSLNVKYEHRRDDIYTWDDKSNRKRLNYSTPHLHRELELVFYTGGKTVAYVDSVRYEPKPGDAFLVFPNRIHSYETLETETFRLFLVKPELMPELTNVFEIASPQSALIEGAGNDPNIRGLYQALAELCNAPESTPYRKIMMHGYLLALFSELLRRMTVTVGIPTEESGALRQIVSYCTQNYDKDLSLTALEEELHLNRYYISHLFSGKLGMCFNDYVNSLRVSEACRCLINTDDSITDISDRVGFNTLRTFNRAFIKQIGMSPSEYRRNGGGNIHMSLPVPPPSAAVYCEMDGEDCCGC